MDNSIEIIQIDDDSHAVRINQTVDGNVKFALDTNSMEAWIFGTKEELIHLADVIIEEFGDEGGEP